MVVYLILALILAFIAVVLVRTVRFTPKPQPKTDETPVEFDKDAAVEALSQLVRCKTVSYHDHTLEDDAEFQKLIALLPSLYTHPDRKSVV